MIRPKPQFDRETSLAARLERLPVVRTEEMPGDKLSVTVRLTPRKWLGLFGSQEPVQRTFELDAIGREVYGACDGKSDVRTIVRRFAGAHKMSLAEAEISVTTFLKTLVSKGLVGIPVERKREP